MNCGILNPGSCSGWLPVSVSERRQIVLAIHARHAAAILARKKTHELRRRLTNVEKGDRIYLYETSPESAVIGGFYVGSIDRDTPRGIWKRIGKGFAISKSDFDAYVAGAREVVAIQVENVFRLRRPTQVRELMGVDSGFSPPQSALILRSQSVREHLDRLLPK